MTKSYHLMVQTHKNVPRTPVLLDRSPAGGLSAPLCQAFIALSFIASPAMSHRQRS